MFGKVACLERRRSPAGTVGHHQAHLQQAEADFEPVPFGPEAARAFGRVAASLRAAGRKPAARANDALIAATALAENVPLFTCNPADFEEIDGLEVRAVPHPDH